MTSKTLITFSGKHNKKYFEISYEDYDRVSQRKWYYHSNGKPQKQGEHIRVVSKATKAEMAQGYPSLIKLHRFIKNVAKKGQSEKLVDHINGNTLDNRRENLRITTSKGNANNRTVHRTKRKAA